MASRKKPAKRTAKRTQRPQSAVQAAQNAAAKARQKRQEERDVERSEALKKAPAQARQSSQAKTVDPRTGLPVVSPEQVRPGDPVGRGAALAAQGRSDGPGQKAAVPAVGLSEAADKIAGLGNALMKQKDEERRSLADPKLFGTSDRAIKERLTAQQNALDETRRKQLAKTGSAVFYGTKDKQIRRAQQSGDFEGGTNRIPETVQIEDIRSKEELMSWLADDTVFAQIKKRMRDSGLQVESYDDVAKLWKSVVDQAAATYSTTGKKVTPWAILSLRSKNMGPNGKPQDRTTTSTTVEEMDPAQARLMFEKSASEYLGRAATDEEIEDFIAKAQTIAKANPNVTKTTTKYDFAGEPVSQTSYSSGGADVVSAQAQVAAEDAAKQDEEYGAFQAAGVYLPWLTDALASPI